MRRELLHARRQVRGLANGCVVHAQIAADGAHDDLPGVDPDADLRLHSLRAAELLRVVPDGLLHPEGGIAGPHRVVFTGKRRTEQRHDAVAHDLIDSALVVMDGVHHQREDRVDELARVFGIAVSEQLHGAFDVGEEHRDLFALALEGILEVRIFSARCFGVYASGVGI
jgi:hypothetical protein